jgi:putative PIG3 family NAD(P)H quinone oxidoreductase
MRAIIISEPGGPEVLRISERPTPDPGPGQILVRVSAAGLNRADLLQRMGLYPAPPGTPHDIPGLEYAGEVSAVGRGVSTWGVGDRVMGIVPGAAMAEYVTVHAREALPVPRGMSLADAAAIPEAFLTAYDAAHLQCGLQMGDRLLVHAVGSGVGTALVQLAKATGAVVTGTSRTAAKLERAVALGLDNAVLAKNARFQVPSDSMDIVVDFVGRGYLEANLRALRVGGQLILVGLLGGLEDQINLGTLLQKRLRLCGTVLRARPLEEKIHLAQEFARRVLPGFEGATPCFVPIVDRIFPMADIGTAHACLAANDTFGKIVLEW